MMKNIKTFAEKDKYSIPLLLLIIAILTYGLLIPTLGLYWDGWPYMWQYHVFGPSGFPDFVASDRPHSAWIFMLLTWLLDYKIPAYHLLALSFRWLSALFIWWALCLIWPKHRFPNALISLLFLVYPGFLQQPISLPYSHHLSHMAMFFFSIWGMLYSIRNVHKYWWLILICIIFSIVVNFSLEYFSAMEFIRPILIWIMLVNTVKDNRNRLKETLKYYAPYLLTLCVFLLWRIFIFKFPTYEPTFLEDASIHGSIAADNPLSHFFRDLYTVSFFAWGRVTRFPQISQFGSTATYVNFGLVVFSTIFLILSLWFIFGKQKTNSNSKIPDSYPIHLILLGAISLSFVELVYWSLDLPVIIEFAWDRLTLSYIFGVSLFISGLILFFIRKRLVIISIFSIWIALAIGFHFQNGMTFKRDWENFQDFFWQLTWRAPDLKPGTILLSSNFPLKYYSDNTLTAPLNWTYDPGSNSRLLNFLFYYLDVRLKTGKLQALEKDIEVYQLYRSFYFEGSTTNSLVVRFAPPGCLQILDPIFANAGMLPNLTQLEAESINLSNLEQIIIPPSTFHVPPKEFFHNEPEHTWCYYYEKADLARQMGDWQEVVRLGDEAESKNFKPRNPSDWLPFIEGYLRENNSNKVQEIIQQSLANNEKYLSGLCYTWKRVEQDPTVTDSLKSSIKIFQAEYNCSQ